MSLANLKRMKKELLLINKKNNINKLKTSVWANLSDEEKIQVYNSINKCFCSFLKPSFSLPITDTTKTAIPTETPLPSTIGSVQIFTNSKAFTASLILVKKIISICSTSQTIPIPTP